MAQIPHSCTLASRAPEVPRRTLRPQMAVVAGAVFLLIGGCRADRERPALSFDVTVRVLVDLHLEHARARTVGTGGRAPADSVLAAHGIREDDFRTTMQYYAQRPELYVVLMDTVVDRMRMLRPSADVPVEDPLFSDRYARTMRDTVRLTEE